MPHISINGAQIYYQAFGQDQPGQAPVLLIHGSTQTGQENWNLVAPLLARNWRVIVPDCRGHGQSSNPNNSYSFLEMAADMAALVRALGYSSAHIIGHSNGGNVALVTLLEHPEIVQTAVLQAANAYVSPDLVEKEPAIFDPERVARQAPDWMERMIALHGPTHGPDYWRDLLRMTVQEIITQPNYTPADLQAVQRPTLVIQGAEDRVNAPMRHGQFIAEHIPLAEAWLPPGVGHTVHAERLSEWIERVQDFLTRRGDPANEALYRLRKERFDDGRLTVFNLHATHQASGLQLSGEVLTASQRQQAIERLADTSGLPAAQISSEAVHVLLDDSANPAPWALVNRPVTDLRRQPRSLSERFSQGLLGEAVRILEAGGEWSRVQMVRDSYIGWMHTAALHACTGEEVQAYQAACQVFVTAELLPARLDPHSEAENQAGKLPFGLRLPVAARQDGLAQVRLPDGRAWWVQQDGLLDLERCPSPDAEGIAFALELFRRFIGIPYMWGGRTPFGYDCSGLAGAFWGFLGVTLPRDADQQFAAGQPVEGQPLPGDLLFFGEVRPDQPSQRFAHVTHVAISLGGDEIIHSNGTAWGVSYNSLDPASQHYRAWLRDNLLGVRRFA
ncbi:MAG: alpha/beta fold hydrolase [Chloroflexota bacterium]